MKNEEIILELKDSAGKQHSCKLVSKVNNQNGQMLYTFRLEGTGSDFMISKNAEQWNHINGDLPYESCVKDIAWQLEDRQL